MSIANLYNEVTGEEWEYMSEGNLDFSLSSNTKYYKTGDTKVELPVLTEENSFSLKEIIPDYYYDSYETEYPKWWVYGYTEKLPVIDGKIYYPFREVMEYAYEDTIQISYEDGVITVTGEHLPDCKTITLTVGSDKAYFDDTEIEIGKVINDGGTVYVSELFFRDALKWGIETARHNLLEKTYYYSFDPYYGEYESSGFTDYPYGYVYVYPEKIPVIDGYIYVPLRQILEYGYEDSVQISYDNGVITVNCEYFPEFATMTLTVGSDKILFDGKEKTVAPVINENGTVYVSSKLFTDIFGWEMDTASHNMTENSYVCSFLTKPYIE